MWAPSATVLAGIQTDSVLSARLQIIRIYIREDGRLVIEFRTQAKFRGEGSDADRVTHSSALTAQAAEPVPVPARNPSVLRCTRWGLSLLWLLSPPCPPQGCLSWSTTACQMSGPLW